MPIAWDNTSPADVQTFLDASSPAFDWGRFWLSPSYAADAIGTEFKRELPLIAPPAPDVFGAVDQWFGNLATGMHNAGIPTTHELVTGIDNTISGAGNAIGDAAAGVGDAANNAAKNTLGTVAPWAIAAGLLWAAVELKRAG